LSLQDGVYMDKNGEMSLIEAIAPNAKMAIDVGANVGDWIYRYLAHAPSMWLGIAIEPVPATALLLRKNIPITHINQIEIKELAVGDVVGKFSIFAEENDGECSSFVRDHTKNGHELVVEVTTIDNEWTEAGCPFIDFLKIDAEGYDLKVLRGATKFIASQQVGVIQFEYNAPWARSGSTLFEALTILSNAGYLTRLLKKEGLIEFNYDSVGEIFSYCNFVSALPSHHESRLRHLLT